MANPTGAFGLRPVAHRNGEPYSGAARRYYIDTAGSDIFVGDPVVLAGSADSGGYAPTVTVATAAANNKVLGPIVAFEPDYDDLTKTYCASGTSRYCYVADNPDLVFEVREDSDTDPVDADDVGNIGILVSGTGSTSTGLSGYRFDSTSPGTANGQYRILGIKNVVDNVLDATDGNAVLLVSIVPAQHSLGEASAT